MLVVFCILFIILLVITVTFFSTLQIAVENFSKSNYDQITKELGNKDFKLRISLYFLGKIKWLSFSANNEKMKKIYFKQKLEQIDLEKAKKLVPDKDIGLQLIKSLEVEVSKLELDLWLGTEDVILTSAIVCVIASGIGIVLPKIMKKNRVNYHINPLYQNKNQYKINFNCIINVKVVHIICVIDSILKRRRVDKNGRTSHRRSYDYSYE